MGGKRDVRCRCGLAFVKPERKTLERGLEFSQRIPTSTGGELIDVDPSHFDFGQKLLVFKQVFCFEILPIFVFEVLVNPADAFRGSGHRFIIPRVKHVKFVRGE